MRYYFTVTGMYLIKKITITSIVHDVEKLKHSYSTGGNLKWCSHFGKQAVFQTLKQMTQKLLGIYPRELKTYVYTKICTQIFIVALL
jgi:hypothetical protein